VNHYAVRLIAPRPTFVQDMTEAERAMMGAHAEYWGGLLASGTAVLFGPVLDPSGPYGLGVLELDDPAEVEKITSADPAVQGGLRAEVHPMGPTVARPFSPPAGR
jgi:uncharacterized protein YciI